MYFEPDDRLEGSVEYVSTESVKVCRLRGFIDVQQIWI